MQYKQSAGECHEHFRQIFLNANKVHELLRRLKVTIIQIAAVKFRSIIAENQRNKTVERLLDVSHLEDPVENFRHVACQYEKTTK